VRTLRLGLQRPLLALLPLLLVAAPAASATTYLPTAKFGMQFVGDPVQVTHTPAALVGPNHVYEVSNGMPPTLCEFTPGGQQVGCVHLGHGYNAWSVARGTDGTIYTGVTSNSDTGLGYLYAWRPGAKAAKVVATMHADAIWAIAVDPATGIVWLGAQSVYAYDPATGRLTGYGMLGQAGESQVHAIAALDGTVYAGLTPYAEVVQLDAATGQASVFQDMRTRTSGVDRIQVDDPSTVEILWESRSLDIYRDGQQAEGYPHLSAAEVTSVPIAGQMYTFLPGGRLAVGWNESAAQPPQFVGYPTQLAYLDGTPVVAAGSIGGQLVGVLDTGSIITITPGTGSWTFGLSVTDLPGTPGIITALYRDPDGSLWASPYIGGEVTHIVGGSFRSFPFQPQADSFAAWQGTLYIGGYPGAALYAYDEARPWDLAAGNPALIGNVQLPGEPQQTRLFALAAGPAGVYAGTIPTDGYLPGDLGYYDPRSGRLQVFPSPVPDEAITSLAYAPNGLLVGATTALGGTGVTPAQPEAEVFLWDPQSQRVVKTVAPLSGEKVWGGLVSTPWGVFGANRSAIFQLDPTTGATKARIFNPHGGQGAWGSLTHMYYSGGRLYLVTGPGQLYLVNPSTLTVAPIFWGAEQAAIDGNYLYFSAQSSVQLWRAPLGRLKP
jgi:hypothetical protein